MACLLGILEAVWLAVHFRDLREDLLDGLYEIGELDAIVNDNIIWGAPRLFYFSVAFYVTASMFRSWDLVQSLRRASILPSGRLLLRERLVRLFRSSGHRLTLPGVQVGAWRSIMHYAVSSLFHIINYLIAYHCAALAAGSIEVGVLLKRGRFFPKCQACA
jgi:hypothetical protein